MCFYLYIYVLLFYISKRKGHVRIEGPPSHQTLQKTQKKIFQWCVYYTNTQTHSIMITSHHTISSKQKWRCCFHNSPPECTGEPECVGRAMRTFSLFSRRRASMSLSVKVLFLESCQKKLNSVSSHWRSLVYVDEYYLFTWPYLKRLALHPHTCCGLLVAQDHIQMLWFSIYQSEVELVMIRLCVEIKNHVINESLKMCKTIAFSSWSYQTSACKKMSFCPLRHGHVCRTAFSHTHHHWGGSWLLSVCCQLGLPSWLSQSLEGSVHMVLFTLYIIQRHMCKHRVTRKKKSRWWWLTVHSF